MHDFYDEDDDIKSCIEPDEVSHVCNICKRVYHNAPIDDKVCFNYDCNFNELTGIDYLFEEYISDLYELYSEEYVDEWINGNIDRLNSRDESSKHIGYRAGYIYTDKYLKGK